MMVCVGMVLHLLQGVTKPGVASSPSSTLVELALPLTSDGAIDTGRGTQPVFAFLPVRSIASMSDRIRGVKPALTSIS
eukprot:5318747-Amphidinium_carterae.1